MSLRKFIVGFLFVIACSGLAIGQGLTTSVSQSDDSVTVQFPDLTGAGTTQWFDVTPYGIGTHILNVTFPTVPAAATVQLQCAKDAARAVVETIASTTWTAATSITGTGSCMAISVNIASLTGAIDVQLLYTGLRTASTAIAGPLGRPAGNPGNPLWVYLQPVPNPCLTQILASLPISQTASTAVIPGRSGVRTVICGVRIVAGAAEITSEWEGTGSACGTGKIVHSGSATTANGESFATNSGYQSGSLNDVLLAGNDWCIGQNGSSQVSGKVWFTRIP